MIYKLINYRLVVRKFYFIFVIFNLSTCSMMNLYISLLVWIAIKFFYASVAMNYSRFKSQFRYKISTNGPMTTDD